MKKIVMAMTDSTQIDTKYLEDKLAEERCSREISRKHLWMKLSLTNLILSIQEFSKIKIKKIVEETTITKLKKAMENKKKTEEANPKYRTIKITNS